MALFRRKAKTTDTDVPAEVQEYYQSERRERVGVAWLLAFGTLVLTIALAIGIFFGGRWVWRKIDNNNKNTATTEQTGQEQNQPSGGETAPGAGSQPSTTPSQDQGGTSTQPQSTPSQTPSANQPSASAPATTTVPSTSSNLANTGPGDTVAIFLGVTILGVLGYQAVIRHKLAKSLG